MTKLHKINFIIDKFTSNLWVESLNKKHTTIVNIFFTRIIIIIFNIGAVCVMWLCRLTRRDQDWPQSIKECSHCSHNLSTAWFIQPLTNSHVINSPPIRLFAFSFSLRHRAFHPLLRSFVSLWLWQLSTPLFVFGCL